MPKTQSFHVGDEPKPETIQRNLEELFEFAHTHDLRTTAPVSTDGSPGDVVLVTLSGSFYLYAKFPSGWKRVQLT